MAAAKERKYSNGDTSTAAIKLLVTSVDCDPKAELPFPDHPMRWDAIVDALNLANYCLAASRHAVPPPQSRVAFLGLHASKKAAFLHSDDEERENRELHYYEITYDEKLMNELPSFCSLKGLPRFHRFTELPEDLQVSIIGRLDGVGFARMRCVSHQFSRLRWSCDFNIYMYLNPDMKAAKVARDYFVDAEILIDFASGVCMAAAAVVGGFIILFVGERRKFFK